MTEDLVTLAREGRYEELRNQLPRGTGDLAQALRDVTGALAEIRTHRAHLLRQLADLEAASAYAEKTPAQTEGVLG